MKKNITLDQLNIGEEQKILDIIYSDEVLKDTFGTGNNRISRLLNSTYAAIIKNNNIPVGFIMMSTLNQTNTHEIDIGILTKYQRKGYGSEALQLLKEIITNNQITTSIQVKKCNLPAIKMVTNAGFTLISTNKNCLFYTLKNKCLHK